METFLNSGFKGHKKTLTCNLHSLPIERCRASNPEPIFIVLISKCSFKCDSCTSNPNFEIVPQEGTQPGFSRKRYQIIQNREFWPKCRSITAFVIKINILVSILA